MPLKRGPNTPEGKAKVSQNALKLGLFSTRVLLRDEDPAALEALSASIHAALEPDGDYEQLLVDRIVAGWWRWAHILQVASAQADTAYQEIFPLGDGLSLDQRHLRSLIASMSNESSGSIQRQADAIERQVHRAVTEAPLRPGLPHRRFPGNRPSA